MEEVKFQLILIKFILINWCNKVQLTLNLTHKVNQPIDKYMQID